MEPNLDGANKVLLAVEGLKDDAEPVGMLNLAIVLQQAHVSLYEVFMSLSILEPMVWDHVWQTNYFQSVPPQRQKFFLLVVGRHVAFLGNLGVGGPSHSRRSA